MTQAELRRLAESHLKSMSTAALSDSDSHELHVTQIELEMQNESLLDAQVENDLALHRYTELYNFAPVGYFVMERNSMVKRTNLQGESQLGLSESAIIGRRFLHFVAVEHRATFCDCLEKVFESGDMHICEVLVQGSQYPLWLSVQATARNTTESLVAMSDITPRKMAEESARASEERYRDILQTAHDGILRLDNKGHLLEINASYCIMSGYSEQDLLSMNIVDLDKTATLDETPTHSHQATKADVDRFTSQHRRKDGTVFDVEVSTKYRAEADGQFVVFIHDITHRVKEQKRLQKLQLEMSQARKMEALGQLSSGVAHDFNNLLAIIGGYTELAESTDHTPTEPERAEYMQTVLEATGRAKDIVAQLLAFSRADTDQEQPMNLATMAAKEVGFLRSMFPSSININIDSNQAEDLPTVLIDSVQVQQLLMNLCSNARDAMDGTGTLTIDVSFVRNLNEDCKLCHQPICGDWVQLKVADTGSGLTAKDMEHLFEPFYTTKPIGEGSGMGLSVVHGIMGRSDRHVLVTSHPGGTEFRLLFEPLNYPQTRPEKFGAQHRREGNGHSWRILAVDDEADLVNMLGAMLIKSGHKPTIFSDSHAALAAFKEHPADFDLVITDETMPGLTGTQLIAAIGLERPDIPVILSSGIPSEAQHRSFNPAVSLYINKPYRMQTILDAVASLLPR
jgi:PAS domain S-box-containing protein